jgi:hypothetical protein
MERIGAPIRAGVVRGKSFGLVELVIKALARSPFASTARAMAKALDEVGGKWMYDPTSARP